MQDPNAALVRDHLREAARRRLRESQCRALMSAGRVLIRDHGLGIPIGHIAVHAGLSRDVARGLFHATIDLATALIVDAWQVLAEHLAARPSNSAADVIAWLIGAIRADAPAHRVHQAMACGAPDRQRRAIDDADLLLVRTIDQRLREVWPALPADDTASLGRRVFALASNAALAPARPDPLAEATLIAAMLAAAAPLPATVDAPSPKPVPWAANQSSVIRFTRLRGRGPVGNA